MRLLENINPKIRELSLAIGSSAFLPNILTIELGKFNSIGLCLVP